MKKFIYLLLALPLFMVSCNSDDDLPNVDFSVTYEGGTEVGGTIYVVQGTELAITGIYVTPVNSNHNAALAGATYYWDYIPAGSTIVEPFGRAFDTAMYSVGQHVITIVCPVLEVDCTPATATLALPVQIVASADDIPSSGDTPADPGTYVPKVTYGSN